MADCRGIGPDTGFKLGAAHVSAFAITGDSSCSIDMSVVPGQVEVVTKPRHGSVSESTPKAFSYQPATGFKGKDGLRIKICGDGKDAARCSLISYRFSVR